jgi:N-acyl-D-aspartate/D-glutamate deacylase
VSGLVVAPGFIDLHAHGQDEFSSLMQARDGVTTALDLEAGVFPVAKWYLSKIDKSPIHFGASVGHMGARIKLLQGLEVGHIPTSPVVKASRRLGMARGDWAYRAVTAEEQKQLEALIDQGLAEGGIGIGFGLQYTPGAGREEIFRLFQLAAADGAPVFVHVRSTGHSESGGTLDAIQEVVANAAGSGASLHICHIGSSCSTDISTCMEYIEGARVQGVDITTEIYPYTAGSTEIGSALFDEGWREKYHIDYGDLQWAATGERLTEETFEKYRREGGWVIIHSMSEETVEFGLTHPMVMIASDGIPFEDGQAHPRGAGTFARVLGHYSRDRQLMPLMEALRKMTLMPAQRLEESVPAMKRKGRLQVGADADITVFDADTIIDRATYDEPAQASGGIVHVIVSGDFVVRNTEPVPGAYPGRPVSRVAGP